MITEVRIDNDTHESASGRLLVRSSTLEVSMTFRGIPNLAVVFMEAQNMGEADGLRHIAAAIEALGEQAHNPSRTLPSHPPEPEPESSAQPRKASTGRRNLQIE